MAIMQMTSDRAIAFHFGRTSFRLTGLCGPIFYCSSKAERADYLAAALVPVRISANGVSL